MTASVPLRVSRRRAEALTCNSLSRVRATHVEELLNDTPAFVFENSSHDFDPMVE